MNNTMILYTTSATVLLIFMYFIFSRLRRGRSATGSSVMNKPVNPEQIYIGNLHFRIRENDLRKFFEQFGGIQDLYIVKNRQNGRSKGYGFVTFDNSDDADKALSAHGEMMNGRNLVVRIARQKS